MFTLYGLGEFFSDSRFGPCNELLTLTGKNVQFENVRNFVQVTLIVLFVRSVTKYIVRLTSKMPEGAEEVPTIGIIYPPPEVRSILCLTTIQF